MMDFLREFVSLECCMSVVLSVVLLGILSTLTVLSKQMRAMLSILSDTHLRTQMDELVSTLKDVSGHTQLQRSAQ